MNPDPQPGLAGTSAASEKSVELESRAQLALEGAGVLSEIQQFSVNEQCSDDLRLVAVEVERLAS